MAEFFINHDKIAMEADKPSINEEWLTFKTTGYIGYFETIKSPLKDENGNLIGVVGVARDITERVKANKELEKNEKWRQIVFDSIHDAIFIVDINTGIIEDVNRQAEILIGKSKDELIGMHQSKLHPAHLKDDESESFKEAINSKDFVRQTEIINADGVVIPVEITAHDIFKIGDREFVCGIFRDLTELKNNQLALIEREETLQEAQRVAKIGSWKIDIKTNQLTWSNQTYIIFGIPIGKTITLEDFLGVIHPDDLEFVANSWKMH
ncbi:MAG: PAS domain S-box protein [Campylobacterales bacterium]|nr:PAS domain S-box protein [Campylobacterales bacterium]